MYAALHHATPGRPRPQSRLLIPDFPFLNSDFQLALASVLSTLSMRRAPKRKSSGLKLFGMSKRRARTQKNRPRKCLGMCCITKYAGLIFFRINVCKKPGGSPLSSTALPLPNAAPARAHQPRDPAHCASIELQAMNRAAYIVSAVRTPIGKFGGGLADLTAADLGVIAVRAALARAFGEAPPERKPGQVQGSQTGADPSPA